jgi:ABC-type Na+ efflux pump permease subunit
VKTLLGVFRYEFYMSIRRWSLWLTFGILIVLHRTSVLMPTDLIGAVPTAQNAMQFAATISFLLNMFMPLIGGILIADRLVRDQKLGVEELLRSTALKPSTYLLGKYLGALCSICIPVLLASQLFGISAVASGAPLVTLWAMLRGFLAINLPALLFVVPFSLACPLIMPVRVYQVLFTGYWFWGNFLSPEVIPTLNGTYLCPNGVIAIQALFGGFFGIGGPIWTQPHTITDVVINLAALGICAMLVLWITDRYLAWRATRI